MREAGIGVIIAALVVLLFWFLWTAEDKWQQAHNERCAQWEAQATTADMKVQVRMTCAKIAQDRANAAQIAAAAVTAGALAGSK